MIDLITILLRVSGAGLILLALLHVPIARRLNWREEAARMSELNQAVFHVHAFFIVLLLLIMGLPALLQPAVFIEPTAAGRWICWSLTIFWALRFIAQWTVYKPAWWKGKTFETTMHWFFSFVWLLLTALFGACAALQEGWLG